MNVVMCCVSRVEVEANVIPINEQMVMAKDNDDPAVTVADEITIVASPCPQDRYNGASFRVGREVAERDYVNTQGTITGSGSTSLRRQECLRLEFCSLHEHVTASRVIDNLHARLHQSGGMRDGSGIATRLVRHADVEQAHDEGSRVGLWYRCARSTSFGELSARRSGHPIHKRH